MQRSVLTRGVSVVALTLLLTGAFAQTGRAQVAHVASASDPNVVYNGGPVLHTVRPYLVFWSPPGSGGYMGNQETLLTQYLTDVSADSAERDDTFGVGRQYYDHNGYADAGLIFTGSQVLTPSDSPPAAATGCPAGSPTPCVSDAQIQAELANLIATDGLPTGVGAPSPGPAAPLYLVVTPPSLDVCDGSTCADPGGICSYHSDFVDGGSDVIYAAIPFFPVTNDPKDCQEDSTLVPQEPNGSIADIVVDDLSHETNEAITDPVPFTGWYDAATGLEAADNCQQYSADAAPWNGEDPNAYGDLGGNPLPQNGATYGSVFDQSINGDRYYTQALWSNGNGNCELSPTPATLTPMFRLPSASAPVAGQTTEFDASASIAAVGVSSGTWNFGDGSDPSFQIGPPEQITHVFANPGTYTVSLTLVDNDGNLATTSRTVTVKRSLDVDFAVSPAHPAAGSPVVLNGTATDPNAGDRLAYYRWSFGTDSGAFGSRATHVFRHPGLYPVTFMATDSDGVTTKMTQTVDVVAPGTILGVSPADPAGRPVVRVRVSGAGVISVGSHLVRMNHAGTATLRVPLSAAELFDVASHIRFTVRVRVAYVPAAGPRVVRTGMLTF